MNARFSSQSSSIQQLCLAGASRVLWCASLLSCLLSHVAFDAPDGADCC